jgi:hypothetical protein
VRAVLDKDALRKQRNLSDEDLREVISRASRLQQQARGARDEVDVKEVAEELDIAPQYVDEALAAWEVERKQAEAEAARAKIRKRRNMMIGAATAGVVGLFVLIGAWSRGGTIDRTSEALGDAEARWRGSVTRQAELLPKLVALSGGDPAPLLDRARKVGEAREPEDLTAASDALNRAVTEALSRLPPPTGTGADQQRLSLQHEVSGTQNRMTVERARFEAARAADDRARKGFLATVARLFGWADAR